MRSAESEGWRPVFECDKRRSTPASQGVLRPEPRQPLAFALMSIATRAPLIEKHEKEKKKAQMHLRMIRFDQKQSCCPPRLQTLGEGARVRSETPAEVSKRNISVIKPVGLQSCVIAQSFTSLHVFHRLSPLSEKSGAREKGWKAE